MYNQNEANFQIENSDLFSYFCSKTDYWYPLEHPQSMFWSRNKKNNVYHCKPQFYYIKIGFKGVKIIKACFRDKHLSSNFRKVYVASSYVKVTSKNMQNNVYTSAYSPNVTVTLWQELSLCNFFVTSK